jgi:hypothetical protein
MTNSQAHHIPPQAVLMGYLQGEWIAHSVQMAAILDLAGLVKDGPKHVEDLARSTNTHAPSLYRLLRALTSVDIFVEVEPNHFAQTTLSETLRFDMPGSVGPIAKMYGQEWQLKAWEHLEHSIRTGKAAVDHVYNLDIWKYLSTHPAQGQLFDQALTGLSEIYNSTLAESYDFSTFATLVDIGGGQGTFLTMILDRYPLLQGVLFDLPAVIENARTQIKPEVRDRLHMVAGSVFTAAPEGGDAYLMKAVLHDWTDEDCIRILRNCRQAMKPTGKLLLFEPLLRPGGGAEGVAYEFLDLLMLINSAGRERTAAEFADIFEASGLELTSIIPTKAGMSILEGVPI